MQGQGRGKNEKGQEGKIEGVAKTKDKKALTGNERLECEGHSGFTPTLHCCVQVNAI